MTGFPFQGGSFGEYAFGDIDGNVAMILDTAAAVTAAGQTVLASITMAISTASGVSISGQTVLATLGMAITASANVTAAGQDVNLWSRTAMGPLFQRKVGGRPQVYWKGRST